MSYDRVLPNPVALRYESAQVGPRPSNLLEHKIMNDLPTVMMRYPDGPVGPSIRYSDARSTGGSQTQQMALNEAKEAMSNGPVKPVGPMLSTKELPMRDRSDRSSSSSASSTSPVKSKENTMQFCLCQPDPKIPRPRNAFILYRQHYQAMVVAHNPGLANPEISKIIGEQWRSLSEDDKSKWKALAEEEKARHQQQYPDYRYQPRRYGRDGSARSSGSGIGHNPSGSSHCNRCGGRLMNAPASPMTPFTPSVGPMYRPSNLSASPHPNTMPRSVQSREKDFHPVQKPKMDQHDHRSRQRHWEEQPGGRSPDNKRRRVSHTSFRPTLHPSYRERSPGNVAPESPHPMTPWSARPDVPQRHLPMLQPQRPYQVAPSQSHPDPSLKLPPLQTATPPAMTPMTPYPQEGSSVEATVMTIPFLNKIKVLAKISPPLLPSFRDGVPPPRGPVIAIDGQDPDLVQAVVEYLDSLLKKETKYHVRVFDGPEIKPPRPTSSEGQMGDATVDYLNTISAWHRISDEVIGFVKSISRAGSVDARSTTDEEIPPNVSPRTLIPKAAALHIHSPAQSSENGSETSAITTASHCAVPIALVPRYQLTTADAFACSTPIGDSYAPLDHWQWMASLWRACVGPDITVYIRECSKEELDRVGAVEVRLQDARTVVLRKVIGRDLEEKALKRMGFEIEDFLTQ